MRHQRASTLTVLATVALLAAIATARQVNISGGGHALDANLRLGSGGYNGGGRRGINDRGRIDGGLETRRYRAGATRSMMGMGGRGGRSAMGFGAGNGFSGGMRYRAAAYRTMGGNKGYGGGSRGGYRYR